MKTIQMDVRPSDGPQNGVFGLNRLLGLNLELTLYMIGARHTDLTDRAPCV